MIELSVKHRSLFSAPWTSAPHYSGVWCRLRRRREKRVPSPLGLAALFPTVCGEWLPSGVLNVTCPDREELAIGVSEREWDELRNTLACPCRVWELRESAHTSPSGLPDAKLCCRQHQVEAV